MIDNHALPCWWCHNRVCTRPERGGWRSGFLIELSHNMDVWTGYCAFFLIIFNLNWSFFLSFFFSFFFFLSSFFLFSFLRGFFLFSYFSVKIFYVFTLSLFTLLLETGNASAGNALAFIPLFLHCFSLILYHKNHALIILVSLSLSLSHTHTHTHTHTLSNI